MQWCIPHDAIMTNGLCFYSSRPFAWVALVPKPCAQTQSSLPCSVAATSISSAASGRVFLPDTDVGDLRYVADIPRDVHVMVRCCCSTEFSLQHEYGSHWFDYDTVQEPSDTIHDCIRHHSSHRSDYNTVSCCVL